MDYQNTGTQSGASVAWFDEEGEPLLTFEWDENGMRIISNVVPDASDPIPIKEEEAVQLRDFLNEKMPPIPDLTIGDTEDGIVIRTFGVHEVPISSDDAIQLRDALAERLR